MLLHPGLLYMTHFLPYDEHTVHLVLQDCVVLSCLENSLVRLKREVEGVKVGSSLVGAFVALRSLLHTAPSS